MRLRGARSFHFAKLLLLELLDEDIQRRLDDASEIAGGISMTHQLTGVLELLAQLVAHRDLQPVAGLRQRLDLWLGRFGGNRMKQRRGR